MGFLPYGKGFCGEGKGFLPYGKDVCDIGKPSLPFCQEVFCTGKVGPGLPEATLRKARLVGCRAFF